MKEEKIVIEIDREGHITADADGFSGDTCLKDLDRLLEGLAPGRRDVRRKKGGDQPAALARTQSLGRKT